MNIFQMNAKDRLLKNDPSLRQLSIPSYHSNTIDPLSEGIKAKEIVEIILALCQNTHIEELELRIPFRLCNNASSLSEACCCVIDNATTEESGVTSCENMSRFDDNNAKTWKSGYEFIYTSLKSNTSIKKLCVPSISCNEAWISLCEGILASDSIEELVLGQTQLGGSSIDFPLDVCESLANLLSHTTKLKKLTLRGLSINDLKAAAIIASGLRRNRSIQNLDVCQFKPSSFVLFLGAIFETNIENLSFYDCEIDLGNGFQIERGEVFTHPFTKILKHNFTLSSLRVTDCSLGPNEISAIFEGMKFNNKVKLVDLSGNDLTTVSCRSISSMLKVNSTLHTLILEDNAIDDNGLRIICDGLKNNRYLQKLNLRSNHITSTGCRALSDALDSSTGSCMLQSLLLSQNQIGDEGGEYLSTTLLRNTTLAALELVGCDISSDGTSFIAEGLAINSTLSNINLSNNNLGLLGCRSLARMISLNTTLQSMYLSSCHIDDDCLAELISTMTLGRNQSLRELWLSCNPFGNNGMEKLGKMIAKGESRLCTISIQFANFDEIGLQYIVKALEYNVEILDLFMLNGDKSTESGSPLSQQVEYWLNLNCAGRCLLRDDDPLDVLPMIFKRADDVDGTDPPTTLFHFLRELPNTFPVRA